MAKICAICEKTSTVNWSFKKLRGKYNPTKKYRKYPNLQWTIVPIGAKSPKAAKPLYGKRVLACTKCIKAFSK